jgi:hypothetical protein
MRDNFFDFVRTQLAQTTNRHKDAMPATALVRVVLERNTNIVMENCKLVNNHHNVKV